MPTGEIEIRINTDGEQEFRKISRKFREYSEGHRLSQNLRTEIRRVGAPIVQELRTAVVSVEVSSSKGGQARPHYERRLRARIASAVRMSVAYRGVRFNVQGALVDPKYGNALAKYMDSELPRYKVWRHPVFGQESVWAVQYGQPWFFETIRNHARDFEDGCTRVMENALRDIAGR